MNEERFMLQLSHLGHTQVTLVTPHPGGTASMLFQAPIWGSVFAEGVKVAAGKAFRR